MHRNSLTLLAVFGVIALMFLRLPPMVAKQDTVLNTYRALVEVDALAHQRYVNHIEDDLLVEGAIRGMMNALDPYSGYIAPDELSSYLRRSHGSYVGIGVEIGAKDRRIVVIAPLDDSPAARAGVLAGDVLLSVDGVDVDGMSVFDVTERLAGRSGTTVDLSMWRPSNGDRIQLAVQRAPVRYSSASGYRRNADGTWDYMIVPKDGVAYIRISHFRENTADALDEAFHQAVAHGAASLVLDLRFNPGGLLDQAVALVDRFLDDGLVVSTATRRHALREYHATKAATLDADMPLVVLINGWSASSAEIVAGALQDHKRAILVGNRSFGKGSVQLLIYLASHRAAIKLTAAYYRLPSGRLIHRLPEHSNSDSWGVQPDIRVELTAEEIRAVQESRRSLDMPRSEFTGSEESAEFVAQQDGEATHTPSLTVDRQLAAAIAALTAR